MRYTGPYISNNTHTYGKTTNWLERKQNAKGPAQDKKAPRGKKDNAHGKKEEARIKTKIATKREVAILLYISSKNIKMVYFAHVQKHVSRSEDHASDSYPDQSS